MDRWTLYELCVQSAPDVVALLRRAHGGAARTLAEDFAGSAAVSRAWVARGGRATAIDLDAGALERAARIEGLTTVCADVTERTPAVSSASDVVYVGNFSILYLKQRERLLAYLRLARERLASGGIFACDTYGGPAAFQLGAWRRERFLEDGTRVVSTWEHRAADPATAQVENVLHFRVEREGELLESFADAFVYRWRLWSISELADALREVGFARHEVYANIHDPLESPRELDGDYSVCIVARG